MKHKSQSTPLLSNIIDLGILSIYLLIIPLVTVIFHVKFYESSLFFFFIPGIYLILRKTKKIQHILVASLGGLGAGFIFDLLATFNHSWYVPQNQLALPRLLGVVPIDDLIWFTGWIFFMMTFYEHFINDKKNNHISKRLIWGIGISLFILCSLLILFYAFPTLLQIHYAYFVCFLFLLPLAIYVLLHQPSLIIHVAKLTAFFSPVFLLHELSALITKQWTFPGFYIGHVEILGITMPFEEFFFFIILSPCIVICYYKFFIDD